MPRFLKVKGHTRADGTKVKGHKRRIGSLQAETRRDHSKARGELAKAIREKKPAPYIKRLKRVARDIGQEVGGLKRVLRRKYRRGQIRRKNTNRRKG